MQYFYSDYIINPPPKGAIFRAKTDDATITAYRSNKVLFQGKNPEKEAMIWQKFPAKKQNRHQQTNIGNVPTTRDKALAVVHQSHIGSDESGTGDYFGPITACAVYVRSDQIETLRSIGIQDSKTIQDQTIQKLVKELITMDIPYSSVVLSNEKYNQLQQSGWSQGKMKAMLHHTAISHVRNKINPHEKQIPIVIDQFCIPKVYTNYLRSENIVVPDNTHFMTKAETYSIAVAAASIFSRARFVEEMNRLSNEIGMDLLKGASHKVDEQIAKIIHLHGEKILRTIAKIHFANTDKAKNLL